jgi:hypothetical protein
VGLDGMQSGLAENSGFAETTGKVALPLTYI